MFSTRTKKRPAPEVFVGYDKRQFRDLITETLTDLEPEIPYNGAAVELLMLTAAQESKLGTYLQQLKGPALGVFQVEPATHDDLVQTFLKSRPTLVQKIKDIAGVDHFDSRLLKFNLVYATIFARLVYFRKPSPLPGSDIEALATYWKKHYNTYLGAGTKEEAIENYRRYAA